MLARTLLATLTALLFQCTAHAASVEVDVRDQNGRAVEGAVVELLPDQAASPLPGSSLPRESIIDQRHETFLPLVTLTRKSGRVIFTNNDSTMHQVYSFSAIKQFAFEIDEGERSEAVVFDKAGIAAIGCNIHDPMIAYVYVAESPWAMMTDASGRATFDAPTGPYRATVWHPRLPPGASPPVIPLTVSTSANRDSVRLSLSDIDRSKKSHMHMQMY